MFKVITLLKKKPGMSREDFIAYYENNHAPLAVSILPGIRHYKRRFPIAPDGAAHRPYDAPEFDVMMEMGFDDEAAHQKAMAVLTQPDIAARIAADEENLFDRSFMQVFMFDEYESDLG